MISGGRDSLLGAGVSLDLVRRIMELERDLDRLRGGEASATPKQENYAPNGDFAVWQDQTSIAALPTATYITDGWRYFISGTAVHTAQRSTTVPTVAQSGRTSNYSLHLDVTTADTSIAAGEYCVLRADVEGYDFVGAGGHVPYTLSWWARDTVTGIHCVTFRNSGADRTWASEYTIAAADTWQWFYTTIDAPPTSGTWNYTNGTGLIITFVLASGSWFQTTPNVWQTGNFFGGTANQVNGVSSTANNFYLSQVALVPGRTPVRLPTYQFDAELARCQRYFCKTFPYATAPAQNTGVYAGTLAYDCVQAGAGGGGFYGFSMWEFPVTMRTTPTMTYYNPGAANALWRNLTTGVDSGAALNGASLGDRGTMVLNAQAAGDAVGHEIGIHATADARL